MSLFHGIRAILLTVILLMTALSSQAPGALYVATNGPAGGNGGSWALAFTNVQTAIDAAAAGDTIYIAGHTFSNDSASVQAFRSQFVWTNKALTILGGYAADGGTPGALTNTPTVLWGVNSSNRILYISGLTNGTLQRVTITDGKGSSSGVGGALNGSGLYIAASSNLTVISCVISGNNAKGSQAVTTYGGGIYLVGSEVRLTDCNVINNTVNAYNAVTYGGGIYIASGSLTISNSVVGGNSAGGGTGSGPKAEFGHGGGVSIAAGALTMRNTLVTDNRGKSINWLSSTVVPSDGIYVGNGSVSLINCTVAYNNEGGIQHNAGTVALTNAIVWGHTIADVTGTVTLAYCDIGVAAGANVTTNNCISTDPFFVDTTYYHLQSKRGNYVGGYFSGGNWSTSLSNSLCIDAGNTNSPYALEPWPNGKRINMGAYGNTTVASLSPLVSGIAIRVR